MKDIVMEGNRIINNPYHDFTQEEWDNVRLGNGLLIRWFTQWIDYYEGDESYKVSLIKHMSDNYEYSAGMAPRQMNGEVTPLGAYDSQDGDPLLEPWLIIRLKLGGDLVPRLAYIYDYGIVAIPKLRGRYHIVRMD